MDITTLLAQVTSALAPQMTSIVIVLVLIGKALKLIPKVQDWLIVWILPVVGIALAFAVLGFHYQAVIQGILAAAVAVLGHQLYSQTKKRE